MTGWDLFKSAWDWEPSVVAGTGLLLAGYLRAVRLRLDWRTCCFVAGSLVMLLALVSPLDALGDDYLFSAHMLQHILLDLVAPLLFVLGCPESLIRRLLQWPPAARAERVLRHAAVAWALGVGTLWVWHLPALYNATLANENVHIFEHLTFLVTGTILWWPIFSPFEGRLAPLAGLVYLFLAALANGLLGAIFTLASTPFYSAYLHPTDELHALSFLRQNWGLTPLADQQLGGAFMWVLGSLIFLGAILMVVARWYHQADMETQGAQTTGVAPTVPGASNHPRPTPSSAPRQPGGQP